jgi:hypothetical protein
MRHPTKHLSTLRWIKQAWNKCPKELTPVIFGDFNIYLCATRDKRDEMTTEMVENVMGLTDLSKHFCQRSHGTMQGRWTWRMRRGRRWISSQCDYFLGRATNRTRYCSICLCTSNCHDLDYCAIITKICKGSEKRMSAYCKQMEKILIKLPWGPQEELCTLFEKLHLDVQAPSKQDCPCNQWIFTTTWALINKRAMLRQVGNLGQLEACLIGRQICTTEKIKRHLAVGEPKKT